MSDNNNSNRKAVYTVIDSSDDSRKARWIRVGIAFENRDGSYNILLDALPVNGKLHVRDFPPADEADAGATPPAAEPAAAPARKSRTSLAAA